MAGVRIKDLQDAKGLVDKFDEFQFAVDSDNPDTTTRLSDNPAGDTVWNELHRAMGRQIAVTASDVYRRAVFNCEVII